MPRRKVNPTYEIAKVLAKLGKASFGDILKETGLAEPTIARHLKHMEAKKLILSEQDPKDKRKYLYWLNPNELAIVTTNEVIESIKEELKAVREELKQEEEQNLREFLIKHFRKLIIEEYLGKEAYREFSEPLYYILRRFSLAILNRLSYDNLKRAITKSKQDKDVNIEKKFEEFVDILYDNLQTILTALEGFEGLGFKEDVEANKELTLVSKDYISSELAKKWIKTKFFKEYTPFGQMLNITPAILAMIKLQSDKRFKKLLDKLQKQSK